MAFSTCRIINGHHNVSKGKLVLAVDFLQGQPAPGDSIYLKEEYFNVHIYKIEKIDKPFLSRHYKLTIAFNEPEWMWKQRILPHITEEDNTAVCGMSVESFYNLDSLQKLEYVRSLIDYLSPDVLGSFLKDNARFAIKLVLKEREGPAGLTKFGGLPVGPAGIQFPKDGNGRSALFVCQVHIAEFNQWFQATKEFSGAGVLYFFATIRKEDGFESFKDILVLYSEDIENAEEISLPPDLAGYGVLDEKDLFVAEEVNLPPPESCLSGLVQRPDEERNREWYIGAIVQQLNAFNGSRLMGHPDQIQGCVLLESELSASQKGWHDPNGFDYDNWQDLVREVAPKAANWRHLFDFDPMDEYFRNLSNYEGEFNQYMDGRFYLMIRQEDLDKMDFSKTVTIYQCT